MELNTANREFNRYKKLKIRLELIREDIGFLRNCKSQKVFPKFIEYKIRQKSSDKEVERVVKEAKRKLLEVELGRHFARAERTRRELYSIHLYLMKNTHESFWREFREKVIQIGRYKSMKKRRIQNNKLKRLVSSSVVCKQSASERNFIINKTSRVFSKEQIQLLNKGLKYKPKPVETPVNEIVVAVESSIKYLPLEEKINVREGVKKVLSSHQEVKPPKRSEWKVIEELKESDSVYLNPDKGKGVVIMERSDYTEAAMEILDDENYELLKTKRKFPVDSLQQQVKDELNKLKQEGFLNGQEVRKLTVSNPSIPSFSCLPKTHKEGNKMRPVVSSVNSPTSEICRFLTQRFRKLKKPFSLSVKNSFEIADKLRNEKLTENEQLISFDVESLYPSVPVEESVKLLSEWIIGQDISDVDAQLYVRLVKLVMNQRWLEFEGKIYIQKEGLFIGNSLSPILAEVFMGNLEKKAQNEAWFPRLWQRYVDDIFAIARKGTEAEILSHLNGMHGAIRFTLEVECSGKLPFLDLEVNRSGDRLCFDIYRKPTDARTNLIIPGLIRWQHLNRLYLGCGTCPCPVKRDERN
jgi:hypothetical protein